MKSIADAGVKSLPEFRRNVPRATMDEKDGAAIVPCRHGSMVAQAGAAADGATAARICKTTIPDRGTCSRAEARCGVECEAGPNGINSYKTSRIRGLRICIEFRSGWVILEH